MHSFPILIGPSRYWLVLPGTDTQPLLLTSWITKKGARKYFFSWSVIFHENTVLSNVEAAKFWFFWKSFVSYYVMHFLHWHIIIYLFKNIIFMLEFDKLDVLQTCLQKRSMQYESKIMHDFTILCRFDMKVRHWCLRAKVGEGGGGCSNITGGPLMLTWERFCAWWRHTCLAVRTKEELLDGWFDWLVGWLGFIHKDRRREYL